MYSSLKSAKVRREQELLALGGSGESYTEWLGSVQIPLDKYYIITTNTIAPLAISDILASTLDEAAKS